MISALTLNQWGGKASGIAGYNSMSNKIMTILNSFINDIVDAPKSMGSEGGSEIGNMHASVACPMEGGWSLSH